MQLLAVVDALHEGLNIYTFTKLHVIFRYILTALFSFSTEVRERNQPGAKVSVEIEMLTKHFYRRDNSSYLEDNDQRSHLQCLKLPVESAFCRSQSVLFLPGYTV